MSNPRQAREGELRYDALRREGQGAHAVYRAVLADGLGPVRAIRVIRALFGLDLVAAKEVMIQAEGLGASLDEHQAALLPAIEAAVEEPDAEKP